MAVAGCSSQPDLSTSVPPTTESKPDIANIAPEGKLTEVFPTNQSDSSLSIMTPNAPPIVLTPIQGEETTASPSNSLATENWQTFTSSALGVSLEYPSDWSAAEEADRVLFTSPAGATIQMKADTSSINNDELKIGNHYCTSRTNEQNLTAEVCANTTSFLYTAKFTLQKANDSTEWLTLSTKARAAGEVFERMFNSVRLAR